MSVPEPLLLRRPDIVTLALVFLVLQFLIPARLVIGGLGAAGRPSLAIALVMGLFWLANLIHRRPRSGWQPVRLVVGTYLVVELLAFAAGLLRGMPDVELRGSVRWLIVIVALTLMAVALADGVPSRERFDTLLAWVVGLAAVMGSVGALQSLAGVDLTRYIRLPGLRLNAGLIGVGARGDGDLARVAGTASHFIEFGVVLAMLLPLAIHRLMYARSLGQRQWAWVMVLPIACGIPFSISRSGTVGIVVALLVMSVVWTWRFRLRAVLVAAVAVVVFRLLQPGVLGTIRSLFSNAENDPSVQDRISDYAYVGALFPERPWLGRGPGTFLPDRYILLDNQFLYTAMASGLLGVLAFTGLFAGGYLVARSTRLRGADAETRHLAQCLGAGLLAGLVCSGTFDSFSFATFTGVTFLLIGLTGALWRLDRHGRRPELQDEDDDDGVVARPWMAAGPERLMLATRRAW